MKGVIGAQGHPALLVGAIRPEWRIHRVGNERRGGNQIGRVREGAGLREQQGQRLVRHGRADGRELVDAPARFAQLHHVNSPALIHAEGGQSQMIRRIVGATTPRHHAKQRLLRGATGFIKRPDVATDVVAENVFAVEFWKLAAAINVATDNRRAVVAIVIEERRLAHAEVRRWQRTQSSLRRRPLKIETRRIGRLDHVQFLARAEAHVADENPARGRIAGHAMRTAQADGEELFHDPGLAHEWIVVGNVVIGGHTPQRLARNGMAHIATALIHIDPPDPAEETVGDELIVCLITSCINLYGFQKEFLCSVEIILIHVYNSPQIHQRSTNLD